MAFFRSAGLTLAFASTFLVASVRGAGEELRLVSRVFDPADEEETLSSSVTIFADGAVYYRCESPPETVVFDPAGERVVVLDRERELKTEVSLAALHRFAERLRQWAPRSSDDLLAAAAASEPSITADANELALTLSLDGAEYQVAAAAAPSETAAEAYRRFADEAVLVQSLLRPGGLPPFLRQRLNAEMAERDWVPLRVALEIAPRRTPLGRQGRVQLASEHNWDPGLADADRRIIREAHAQMADFRGVSMEAYAGRELPAAVLTPPSRPVR